MYSSVAGWTELYTQVLLPTVLLVGCIFLAGVLAGCVWSSRSAFADLFDCPRLAVLRCSYCSQDAVGFGCWAPLVLAYPRA